MEQTTLDAEVISAGINELMISAGDSAKASGWHKDRPTLEQFVKDKDNPTEEEQDLYKREVLYWRGMKIMLMVTELSEAIEELRKGHDAADTYYGEKGKPEGVPSELADVIIRIMDFCYTEGIDIADMIVEKLLFNGTRGHRHGGKTV